MLPSWEARLTYVVIHLSQSIVCGSSRMCRDRYVCRMYLVAGFLVEFGKNEVA
jgi:hypothetical protein